MSATIGHGSGKVFVMNPERWRIPSVSQGSSTPTVPIMSDIRPNTLATEYNGTVWPEHDTEDASEANRDERTDAVDVDQVIERDTAVLGNADKPTTVRRVL